MESHTGSAYNSDRAVGTGVTGLVRVAEDGETVDRVTNP